MIGRETFGDADGGVESTKEGGSQVADSAVTAMYEMGLWIMRFLSPRRLIIPAFLVSVGLGSSIGLHHHWHGVWTGTEARMETDR